MSEEPRDWSEAQAEIDSASRECVYDALQDGHVIRSCHYCDNFDYWGLAECRKLEERVAPANAVDCEFFSLADPDALSAILSDY